MLGRDEIRRLIPHGGTMCLLEEVLAWDAGAITCRSASHVAPDNPLARDGRVGALGGLEYCLQAMAVHGALVAEARQPVGYVVRLGDVVLDVAYLDELGDALVVRAELVQALPAGYAYAFSLSGAAPDAAPAIRGRATIALIG